MDKDFLPDRAAEKVRYQEHLNDVNDLRYQQFVNPIVEKVFTHFSKDHAGLDFGAGTAPVISKLLADKAYQIVQYDPFFHYAPQLLYGHYDYIVSCEVIEHFHAPAKEFQILKNMLKPGGKLICMTNIYKQSIDFKSWYYKDDPTHVFFYQQDTLAYIKERYGFSDLSIEHNLIVFSF
ncbi:MAG: class I SAM-dependent methyltransferase [Paludibacteraceae bacterium]|nr:class I SAM-dependent methyltransferase [Paludibacteraceae bacterium]